MDEREQNRILSLLDDVNDSLSDNDQVGGMSDEEVDDYVEENVEKESSDSEHDISETEDDLDVGSDLSRSKFYFGKDKQTKWLKDVLPSNVRTRSHNIITHLPGCKPVAKNKSNIVDYFHLLFDNVIIRIITSCTNKYIISIAGNFERERDANPTSESEIESLIGLLILAGVNRSGRQNLEDLWDQSGFGVEIFHVTMSLKRFRFLLRCLRFDDMGDRIQRREIDKLAPIRELFELFVENCKKCFSPSEYVTIDEQLVKFRGRCPFRVYLPNKPAKYGVKIFALVDAKMMYTWNMEVYCAKQPVGPYNISNSPSDVVMRLMNPILGSGRNLTTDNWYTSIPLAENLLKNKITLVGTMRKNKKEIPVIFQQQFSKNRELNSTIFGFQKDLTLISYKPKPNKIVILLSSMHHDAAIDESTTDARKPEIITFYNSTKGAVDTVDEMCGSYDAGRNNRRWPLTIFFHLINTAGINSEILYHCDQLTSNALKRRVYLRNLAMSLIKPRVLKRAAMQNIPKTIRHKAARISGIPFVETEQNLPKKTGSNGRCALCPRSEDKRTRNFCDKCNHWVCGKHYSKVCSSCMDSSSDVMDDNL